MIKKILRVAGCTVAVLFVVVIGCLVYLTEPHIAVSEVRTTGNLETIRGLYGRACEEDFISEFKDDQSLGRLTLVVPEGGIGPEDTNAVVPGNVFEITGYRYKRVRRNIFSGKVEETPGRRFDVVKWRAVLPYQITDKHANIKEVNTPLGWRSPNSKPKFPSSPQSESGGC